ncbi:Soluble lytic murein transglycosylase [Hoeflea phototrophica DFL-43]|uniref:Soluble lytic murein transglycosylase n=1 Tax=Hoeflea phototrophica (strain DSM 17068 / NCIMB 14078 / DFL-43) TaxID=411684 RepID=A9DDX5_HOEPD|nr:transglycosylase SLT domain-containing protein [Hoeflea phototrophica]EDQ31924.1 Soluble lytic murein transglycosylase [Hoeflea phototrophica DFL-43]
MRSILPAAAAALLTLVLAGCETTGTSGETTGSISKGKTSQTTLELGYAGRPHGKLISSYAKANGIPESLAHAVITVESNYRASARGAAGEVGLMQIKPSTARMMGYRGSTKGLYHPETNIKYGMKYLAMAHKLGGGTTCGTILKYNAGHAAKRMNPISKRYCGKVARLMK